MVVVREECGSSVEQENAAVFTVQVQSHRSRSCQRDSAMTSHPYRGWFFPYTLHSGHSSLAVLIVLGNKLSSSWALWISASFKYTFVPPLHMWGIEGTPGRWWNSSFKRKQSANAAPVATLQMALAQTSLKIYPQITVHTHGRYSSSLPACQ